MKAQSIFALIIALLVGTAAEAKYSGGTGEPNDPYLICSAESMNEIGANPDDWGAHFLVICDINLADYTGTQFNIIGYYISSSNNKPFTGIFDGNNHTISNFTYTTTKTNIGIFGYINDPNAEVKNLTLTDPNVKAGSGGCLVGRFGDGTISGCGVEGGSISRTSVGGLVGTNSGTITNCYFTGNVIGSVVGGLVCGNSGTIMDCYSDANISGTGPLGLGCAFGGLVASNSGTIMNCYSTGNVSGTFTVGCAGVYVGGLAASNSGTITNCYSDANASGRSYQGGENYVGGLVARNSGMITNCYATGIVSGTEYGCYHIGGLVGGNDESCTITYCYSTGSVSISGAYAYGFVGGLVGYDERAGVVSSFWDIETSGQLESAGGMLKNTAEMKLASTYIGWGGCGNEDVWTIDDGHDYPHLAWEGKPGQIIGEQQLSDYVTGGSGEPNDPYLISNGWQFNLIGSFPCEWDKHFKLVADVNLAGYTMTQFNIIGRPSRPFTGVFDGNDHKVMNFTYVCSERNYIGLFQYLGESGQIKELGLENVVVSDVNGYYVSGLVGYNNSGTITDCYSTGNVTSGGGYEFGGGGYEGGGGIGGLVGENYGTITNCYSTSRVTVEDLNPYNNNLYVIGGLVGLNSGTIINCYSTGHLWGECVGGLVGKNCGKIANCYSIGNVVSEYGDVGYAGGLVGRNSSYGMITNCYSTGNVFGTGYHVCCIGGLVGSNFYEGTITNCYSTGNVSGERGYIGGLVGDCYDGSIISSYFLITSGPDNGCGEPLTDEQMKQQSSFVGWDFVCETVNGPNEVWTIKETVDYPRLLWECFKDYQEWLDVNKPPCWGCSRQCHGDVDNQKEGSTKGGYYYVHFADLALLQSAWNIKEPPHGPGIAWPDPNICADFDHKAEGSTKTGYYRVHFHDLAVLLSSWNIKEPPDGQGIGPNCNCLGYCP